MFCIKGKKMGNHSHLIPLFFLFLGADIITAMMKNKPKFIPNPHLKLMDQIRETMRDSHYPHSTEKHIASEFYDLFIFTKKNTLPKHGKAGS
jgi:hypothetical protein